MQIVLHKYNKGDWGYDLEASFKLQIGRLLLDANYSGNDNRVLRFGVGYSSLYELQFIFSDYKPFNDFVIFHIKLFTYKKKVKEKTESQGYYLNTCLMEQERIKKRIEGNKK